MARKFQVTQSFNLGTPADPNTYVVDEQIDLALLMSQRLQRNLRQGKNYIVKSVQASLSPQAGADTDLGIAFSGQLLHCPTTKNSVSAWRHAFKVWKAQKNLRMGAMGHMVKYDDMEVAWNSDHTTSRTSTVYADGLNDTNTEDLVIYGTSTSGSDLTLQDLYESAVESPSSSVSRFPISNAVVKEPKFTDQFPEAIKTPIQAHFSTINDEGFGGPDSGAQVYFPKQYVNLNVLCGIMRIRGWMLPENTVAHTQDDVVLTLVFEVMVGNSLASGYKHRTSRPAASSLARSAKRRTWKRYRRSKK